MEERDDNPRRVLLVDENLMFTPRVEGQLRRLGFAVETIAPAAAGAARVRQSRPAFVLLNLAARGADPLALARQWRADPELAGLKVLGYAGHKETALLHAAREAGVEQVLANSAVVEHLEAVLRGAGELEG